MKCTIRTLWGVTSLSLVVMVAACGDDTTPPVDNAPTVTLTAPAGGEAIAPGATFDITWTAADDGVIVGVDLSYVADGVAETDIATVDTGSTYSWTVPNTNLFGLQVIALATDDASQTGADTTDILAVVQASARGYVTAEVCKTCHQTKYDDVFDSGHPYKLNKVVNAQPPTYPFSSVPNPPAGFAWSDITYVIGGYGWKARFLNDSGWVMTDGVDGVNVQYNLPRSDLGGGLAAEWTSYHATDTQRKPYDCGTCHTTGWQDLTQNGGVHQDGLIGIEGTWEETGIKCEECHGPGVNHVAAKDPTKITVDNTSELCGSCHFRDADNNVLASGGFIRHHEQYDEFINGGNAGAKANTVTCGTCHEPHIGVRYGNDAAGGILVSCESCHAAEAATNNHVVTVDCESCHMARATKSARAVHLYEGDVRSHLFTINTNPFPKDSMFFLDPVSGNTWTKPWITLDFACYTCHNDGLGNGGAMTTKTLAELSARATGIHQ